MVTPRCPCEQGKELWGEMWWAGRQSRWVFFDGRKNGVIWCAPMMYCLDCGYRHERDGLIAGCNDVGAGNLAQSNARLTVSAIFLRRSS